PLTCHHTLRRSAIDLVELITRESDRDGADVFRQSFDTARARYREHVVARQQPRERELRGSTALRRGHIAYTIGERHVALEVTALKPRIETTPIVRREIVKGPEAPPEKATPKRTVRDQRDAQLSECREKFVLRIAAEQRVFGLHGSDRMDAMCTPQCLQRHLRQPEMPDLSLPHQISHRTDRVLDGHFR